MLAAVIVAVIALPLIVLEMVSASATKEHADCQVIAANFRPAKGYQLTTSCGTFDVPASRAENLPAQAFQAGSVCAFTTRGVAFGGDRRQIVGADCTIA